MKAYATYRRLVMSAWKAGKVHYWDPDKGTGMILDTEDGDFFFVHYSAIESKNEHKDLEPIQKL